MSAPTDHITADERMFHVGVAALARAQQHQAGKQYNKVLYNIDVMVFSIWWCAMVLSFFSCNKCFYLSDKIKSSNSRGSRISLGIRRL
jgi:hypothetical protein